MKIWIICSGGEDLAREKDLDAAGYLAALRRVEDRESELPPQRPMKRAGRTLLCAPGRRAMGTAALFFEGESAVEEPLLAPAEPPDDGGRHSAAHWRRLSRGAARARADELLDRLEREGRDCVLIASVPVVKELLERARVRGYCQARTGVFALKPLEHIQLSLRSEHCGFCNHNCLLSNPGCDIGRDKARRQGAIPIPDRK